jgi:hypothetical protein
MVETARQCGIRVDRSCSAEGVGLRLARDLRVAGSEISPMAESRQPHQACLVALRAKGHC